MVVFFYAVSASETIFMVRMIVQLFSPPSLSPLTSCKEVPETYSTSSLKNEKKAPKNY